MIKRNNNDCAIIGDGIAGSALYRLIKNESNIDVSIFGRKHFTSCGMKSCAWGVNREKFEDACRVLQLNANKYYTNYCNHYYLGRLKIKCDVIMIDKKLLLYDLAGDDIKYEEPVLSNYNKVIDATGTPEGSTHKTFQVKVKNDLSLSVRVGLFPLHCRWLFPLGNGVSHVGILCFGNNLNGLEKKINSKEILCKCYSQVYCKGLVKTLVKGNIWKVGEAAGVIDPITGSGILLAMNSAFLLYRNWDNPKLYERDMNKMFGYTRNLLLALFHNKYRGLRIGFPCGWKNG